MRPANPDTVIIPTLGRKPGGGSLRKLYVSDVTERSRINQRSYCRPILYPCAYRDTEHSPCPVWYKDVTPTLTEVQVFCILKKSVDTNLTSASFNSTFRNLEDPLKGIHINKRSVLPSHNAYLSTNRIQLLHLSWGHFPEVRNVITVYHQEECKHPWCSATHSWIITVYKSKERWLVVL